MTTTRMPMLVPASIDHILPHSCESWRFLLKNSLVDLSTTKARRRRGKYMIHSKEKKALIVLYSELNHCSITHASEELEGFASALAPKKSRAFKDGRRRRFFPHQTDVNEFIRHYGTKKAYQIAQNMLDRQLIEARNANLIKPQVNLIVDFNEQAYYGKRTDSAINGTNRQKGTEKMRHYMRYMLISDNIHLFAGSHLVHKGQSKIPIIQEVLEHIHQLGFEIKQVLWDREFYRAELFDSVKSIGSQLITPAKKYKRVRQFVVDYLNGHHGRVFHYKFTTGNNNKMKVSTWTWLIMAAKNPDTLTEIKRAFRSKRLTLDEAANRIYAFMVVRLPSTNLDHWKRNLSNEYKKRWLIETGFRDINKLAPRWRTNLDHEREIGEIFRMMIFNSWQLIQEKARNQQLIKSHLRMQTAIDAMRYSILTNLFA